MMNIKIIRLLVAAAMSLLLLSGEVLSQTSGQRATLVTKLNGSASNLLGRVVVNPDLEDSESVTIPAGISVKGYDGDCSTPASIKLKYNPDFPSVMTLVVTLRDQTTMDIPELSHVLICELNNMIWHLFDGNTGRNWSLDADGNVVLYPWHYDANCSGGADQKFWRVDADQIYSGVQLQSAPGVWYPLRINDGSLLDLVSGTEVTGTIYSADFVEPHNGESNIWIARRHDADDGRIEIKRAYTRIEFDYDYHDDGLSSLSTAYKYIDPFYGVGSGYDKKLTAIEVVAQTHKYAPDDCPEIINSTAPPLSDRAELTMTLYYENAMGTPCSTSCVQSWSAVPSNPDADNQALWNRMFGDYGGAWGGFNIDENGYLYFQSNSCTSGSGACISNPDKFGLIKLRSREVPADQCEMALQMEGDFSLDDMTGEILYTSGAITDKIFCFDFCETLSGHLAFDNVISASAQTFSNEWSYDPGAHGTWNTGQPGGGIFDPYYGLPDNPFQRSERGKWRPDKAYVYRSSIKSGVGAGRIYDDAGVFTDDAGSATGAFQLFDWRDPGNNNDKWLNPVTIVKYDPSGESIEEQDILDVHGTAKLAHKETVPRLVAQNATYDAVDFQSFEDHNPGGLYTDACAHSGELSYQVTDNGDYSGAVASVTLTDQIDQQGLLIKLWVKQTYNVFEANPTFANPPIGLKVAGQVFTTLAPANYNTLDPGFIHKVAQTGDWSLYQLIVDDFGTLSVGDPILIEVKNNIPIESGDHVWIDDIRAQPLDAAMTCFVYDRHTLRLIGQFDDQHFGIYSRYNGEGNVVSLLRETEQGVLTVTESQSWLLTQPRHTEGGSSIMTVPTMPVTMDRPGFTASGTLGRGGGTDFDIASLHIGPEGPSVDLLGVGRTPLENLEEILDFKSDFPGVEPEKLAELAPKVPEIERLKLLRELMKLDEDRAKLEKEGKDLADAEKEKELQKRIDEINTKRDAILHDKLGLTAGQIEMLYKELGKASEKSENDDRTKPATDDPAND